VRTTQLPLTFGSLHEAAPDLTLSLSLLSAVCLQERQLELRAHNRDSAEFSLCQASDQDVERTHHNHDPALLLLHLHSLVHSTLLSIRISRVSRWRRATRWLAVCSLASRLTTRPTPLCSRRGAPSPSSYHRSVRTLTLTHTHAHSIVCATS
jgi:hypothetical protein